MQVEVQAPNVSTCGVRLASRNRDTRSAQTAISEEYPDYSSSSVSSIAAAEVALKTSSLPLSG